MLKLPGLFFIIFLTIGNASAFFGNLTGHVETGSLAQNKINEYIKNTIYYSLPDIWVFNSSSQIDLPDSLKNRYVGTYRMTMDKSRTMEILKKENQLLAKYSKDIIVLLNPSSTTKFIVEGIQPEATLKFILEKGKVTKYIAYQGGSYEWIKIK